MKRSPDDKPATPGVWSCPDKDFLKKFPTLMEGMSDPWWEDGKPRTVWTLTFRVSDSEVSVSVNDREGNRSTFTSAPTFMRCLELIETMASRGAMAWRAWKDVNSSTPRRKS